MKPTTLKWEKPKVVSLQAVAIGACSNGSTAIDPPTCHNGGTPSAICSSGGTADNFTCVNGGNPQSCSTGTRPRL
jgi:hypothetical protein